jgi:hypothetical protein
MSRTIVILSAMLVLIVPLGNHLTAEEPCGVESIEAQIYNNCDGGVTKWIQTKNETSICQIVCLADDPEDPKEKCGIDPSWIGGTVYADESAPNGFYFDPSTVVVAEIVAETYQTNICQIAANPKGYDGGLWYIPFDLRGTR